jgi:hypothetical protein
MTLNATGSSTETCRFVEQDTKYLRNNLLHFFEPFRGSEYHSKTHDRTSHQSNQSKAFYYRNEMRNLVNRKGTVYENTGCV